MRFFVVLAMVLVIAAIAIGVSRSEKAAPGPEPPRPQAVDTPVTSTPPTRATHARQVQKLVPPAAPLVPVTPTSTPSPATTSTVVAPPGVSLFAAFTLEADDAAFYPNSVSVDRDQTVSLTFRVRSEGVRGGGLDIRSSYFSVEGIAAGTVKTVTFHAPPQPANITFNSFAQGTGNLLGTGTIIVR